MVGRKKCWLEKVGEREGGQVVRSLPVSEDLFLLGWLPEIWTWYLLSLAVSGLSPASRNVSKHGGECARPKAKLMSNCVSCKQQSVVGLLQSGWKEKLWVGKIATRTSQERPGQVKLCSGFVCQPSAKGNLQVVVIFVLNSPRCTWCTWHTRCALCCFWCYC